MNNKSDFRTVNGKLELKPIRAFTTDDINIDAAFNVLSRNQRWAGKLPVEWSVLDHCLMSYKIAKELNYTLDVQLYALLHDFAECVTGDVITPIKRLIPNFNNLYEEPIVKLVYELIGLSKTYDHMMQESTMDPQSTKILCKQIDNICSNCEIDIFLHQNVKIEHEHIAKKIMYELLNMAPAKRRGEASIILTSLISQLLT